MSTRADARPSRRNRHLSICCPVSRALPEVRATHPKQTLPSHRTGIQRVSIIQPIREHALCSRVLPNTDRELQLQFHTVLTVLSTDQEMIPARNATDTHAHIALAHSMLLETLDVLSLYAEVELSVSPTNSRPVVPCMFRSSSHRARHAHPLQGSPHCLWSADLDNSLTVLNLTSPHLRDSIFDSFFPGGLHNGSFSLS